MARLQVWGFRGYRVLGFSQREGELVSFMELIRGLLSAIAVGRNDPKMHGGLNPSYKSTSHIILKPRNPTAQ